jgi:formyl-CoA transferase
MVTGPLTGMLLADFGAEIVKFENPEGGDPLRDYGRGDSYSSQYCSYNRNKRSVALSLRTPLGRRTLERLVERSDVLIENFRPGVLDRLGFPDARLIELNPRLVRCSITGFGSGGPYAARACYDAIAQALSGMSSQFLDPVHPRLAGITIADNVTGQYACQGILAALYERERTGVGRRVEVNMLEASMAFMPEPFGYYTQDGQLADAYLRVRNSQAYVFRCADNKMIATHLSSRQKFWERFLVAIGRTELQQDSRFLTLQLRIDNYVDLQAEAAKATALQPQAHWLQRFADCDVPVAPVNDVTELFSDPQIAYLDSFFRLEHPEKCAMVAIRRPVRIDGARDDQRSIAPPLLGEHTAELLCELGLEGKADVAVRSPA